MSHNQGGNHDELQATKIEELKNGFKGEILLPGDDAYESARKIWNAMIDKRPALIARCATTSDVVRAVNFARDNGLLLAVRGGGHNIAGNAMCDDGIVIDLSQMKAASVDPGARRVTIEGGATLADLDAATQAHGLATPVGINSTTGIAGLTLGGGFGWLSRKYGMTVDNLESAEVVTAAGEVVRASATEHPDLFWALRGGGGNFGVVTRFEFRLHPVGPDVLSGLIVYPISEAKSVLQQYREFIAKAPEELSVWTVLRQAPPLPFLPERSTARGSSRSRCSTRVTRSRASRSSSRCASSAPRWANTSASSLTSPGSRPSTRCSPPAPATTGSPTISRRSRTGCSTPSSSTSRSCRRLSARSSSAPSAAPPRGRRPDSTAYAHRDAQFVMNVHGRWEDPADDERCIGWARDFFNASAPFASGGVYVNFLTADEGDRVRSAYGPNYDRLAQVKRKYDPNNLFRMNQNIKPA